MTKVLVATVKPFAKVAVQGIREIVENAGYEFDLIEKYGSQEDLKNRVKDADALIIRSDKVDREVIEAGERLKIVVRAGAGFDNVDLEAATQNNVVVMNTPGQNSNAVAELVLAMMVYYARNHFNGKPGTEIKGKSIGLHAYGNVSKNVARIAEGFGMKVYAYDPFIPQEVIQKDGVEPLNSVEELYKTCQYVSLHIPATEQTKKSINKKLMNLMPNNAVIVNTARKEIICEDSLVEVFKEREDFGYISDIAPDCAQELSENYPDRLYFTPKKMGAQTAEANINAGLAAANQIREFLENGDTSFQVNK
jgi:D-3-phosphoglycerate dehydrogenase